MKSVFYSLILVVVVAACEKEGYERFNRKNDGFQIVQMLDRENKHYGYRP